MQQTQAVAWILLALLVANDGVGIFKLTQAATSKAASGGARTIRRSPAKRWSDLRQVVQTELKISASNFLNERDRVRGPSTGTDLGHGQLTHHRSNFLHIVACR
jgi:hypothetical protein